MYYGGLAGAYDKLTITPTVPPAIPPTILPTISKSRFASKRPWPILLGPLGRVQFTHVQRPHCQPENGNQKGLHSPRPSRESTILNRIVELTIRLRIATRLHEPRGATKRATRSHKEPGTEPRGATKRGSSWLASWLASWLLVASKCNDSESNR